MSKTEIWVRKKRQIMVQAWQHGVVVFFIFVLNYVKTWVNIFAHAIFEGETFFIALNSPWNKFKLKCYDSHLAGE